MSVATEITRLQKAKADIKSAIESKGVTVGDGLIDTYAEKIDEIPTGGSDEYQTAMWNSVQDFGNRDDYNSAFVRWVDASIWTPIHDMTPKNALAMFREFNTKGNIFSLPERCEQQNISIDFSNATALTQLFQNANINDVGIVDCTSCTSVSYALSSPYIVKAIMVVNEKNTFSNTFSNGRALVDLIMRGTIGTTVSFKDSPLNKASIENIFGVLLSSATGQTTTFNKNAVNKAFETAEGANDGSTSAEWNTLVASKPNWTISMS